MTRAPHFDWYLNDWMATMDVTQADMQRKAGWSKRKASQLCDGSQRYNRDVINEAAMALNCRPFELLLHPSEAMEYRSIEATVQLAAERRSSYQTEPEDLKKIGTNAG